MTAAFALVARTISGLRTEPFGVMALAVYGPAAAIDAAFGWMRGLGLVIEEDVSWAG